MNCNTNPCTPTSKTAPSSTTAPPAPRTVRPQVDAWADDAGVRLLVDVPGVGPSDVELTAEGASLRLRATPSATSIEGQAAHTEWRPAQFERSFELASEYDLSAVSASLRHGLLEILVPRHAAAQPRKIDVQAGE